MQKLVESVLENSSRAERRYMQRGDLSVALWLTEKTHAELTPSQIECVAVEVMKSVHLEKHKGAQS